MENRDTIAQAECGYVELFTTERTGKVFGYRLVGAKSGPQIVVAGLCPSATRVFERLLSIPTLPWIRGNLVLIHLDALDDIVHDISSLTSLGIVDRTIILPGAGAEDADEPLVRRNYHLVLRACAQLGMITGRGVAKA